MNNTALIIIDVQKGLDEKTFWGFRNNPQAEQNMALLLSLWRENKMPVIHIQHRSQNIQSPLHPSKSGYDIKDEVSPIDGELHFTKTVNSAFIGTDLEQTLKDKNIEQLVIVGLTTEHCVSTTTRMAGNLGFDVILVSDATASFDKTRLDGKLISADDMHHVHLASLHEEFCMVKNTQEVLNLF